MKDYTVANLNIASMKLAIALMNINDARQVLRNPHQVPDESAAAILELLLKQLQNSYQKVEEVKLNIDDELN